MVKTERTFCALKSMSFGFAASSGYVIGSAPTRVGRRIRVQFSSCVEFAAGDFAGADDCQARSNSTSYG